MIGRKKNSQAFTVALLGPDGAGKSTVGRRLPDELGRPASYVYMGVNLESSDLLLPTTRLLLEVKRLRGRRPDLSAPAPGGPASAPDATSTARSALASVKLVLRMTNLIAEEWFRQLVVWWHRGQGRVVVLDRHFFYDYHDRDVAPSRPLPMILRLHGFMLRRLYPRPELVIVLDAPGSILFARKGEGSPAALERRRSDYLRLRREADCSAVVDATRPIAEVLHDVVEVVNGHHGRSA